MFRLLTLCACLAWPLSVHAKSPEQSLAALDVREVQTDTTDVFAVLITLKQAETALSHRNYQAARQGFESVLMHDPNLAEARKGMRRTLIAIGDIKAARAFIEDTNSADSLIVRIRLGEISAPLDLLKASLKNKSDPRLWTLMGQIQDTQKDHALARQSYAMSGLSGARAGLAENNIGQSHWLAGEYELALQAFEKAVKEDPLDTQFDNNRRRALVHLGQTQIAIAGLEAARAGLFLTQAADKAASENEIKLAKLLYRKSLEITPRYNPRTAEKLARLEQ